LGPAPFHELRPKEKNSLSVPVPPTTYAAWQDFLDRFRDGDDSVIAALEGGRIEWSPSIAERWTSRMTEVLADRLRALSAQLQKDLNRAQGDRHGIESALIHAGRSLDPLARFCRLPCAPAEVRSHLLSELERWSRQTRASLESNLTRERGDQGALLRSVRAASARLEIPPERVSAPPASSAGEFMPSEPRRRILS
jgi:hypothetical protein